MTDANAKNSEPENFELLLENEKKRSEDYLNRLKYLQADFENVKKRFDREIEQVKCYCNERIVFQLLDIVDELELAVKNGEISSQSAQILLEGVEMTLNKLRKVLEQEGVTPIDNPEGKVFDPARHNAITTETRDDVEACTVIEEIRKGYMMKGKVLRPTIVKVAVRSTKNNQNQSNKTEEKNKDE
jgi:molecular chaperone GrpE